MSRSFFVGHLTMMWVGVIVATAKPVSVDVPGGPVQQIAATADGGFQLLTVRDQPRTLQHLVRVGKDGSRRWALNVPDRSVELMAISPLPDGGVLCAGSAGDDGLLMRLDAKGKVLWQKLYRDPAEPVVFYALAPSNNEVWAVGDLGAMRRSPDNRQALAVKVRLADGSKVCATAYGGPLMDRGIAVSVTPDGGALVAGPAESREDGRDGRVARLNASGGLVWQRLLRNQATSSIAAHGQHGFVHASFRTGGSVLSCFDLAGKARWHRRVTLPAKHRESLAAMKRAGEDYLLSGTSWVKDVPPCGVVLIVSGEGQPRGWASFGQAERRCHFYDAQRTASGGLVAVGEVSALRGHNAPQTGRMHSFASMDPGGVIVKNEAVQVVTDKSAGQTATLTVSNAQVKFGRQL